MESKPSGRSEKPELFVLNEEHEGLRILARIIARKRLRELGESNGNKQQHQPLTDASPANSTTVLLRDKKRKQCWT